MKECKHCGNNDRVIKYGIKANRHHLLQRWFCYNCRRLSYSPLEECNNNNDLKVEKYHKEKTERQLLKLAGRSAFAATRRRSGYFAK
jgi:hypothetical protein